MKACPACNSRYEDQVTFCSKDGTPVVVDAVDPAVDAMIGQVIADRYRLLRKLGEGGMGEVYEAEHIHIEKRVALKLLRAEILSNQEAVTRFRQEARSASSIGHENIIEIDDFGVLPDGRVYLTMEFLAGAPLADLAKEGLSLERALDILMQTCHGLGAAHAKGIIHRDMKPENIYVTHQRGKDIPKILDFGIAKVSGTDNNQHLTRTGTIFGTPFYMAPEQALGQGLDHRADVYAMGVIMFEIFTGTVPFRAESFMGILTQHITNAPPPPSQTAAANGRVIPPELESLILKALAKDPKDRFQSMNELVMALNGIYRQYVGAGSTMPLQAAPVSPSQFVPVQSATMQSQPTPMPTPMPSHLQMPSGLVPGGGMAMGGQFAPLPPPPIGMAPPAHVPFVMPQAGSQSMSVPASGGGGKIVLAICGVLLLAGAGAGWYFMLGPGKKKAEEPAAAVVTEPTKQPDPVPLDPDKPPPDKTPVLAAADAGVAGAKTPDPIPVPDSNSVIVLVNSTPQGASIYGGSELLGKTPRNIAVTKGTPVALRLELSGYDDTSLTLDGAEESVTAKLDKKDRVRPPRDPDPKKDPPPPIKKVDPPPKKDPPPKDPDDDSDELE